MVIMLYMFFFFNDTATTEIYTLSLHDALPIFAGAGADRDEARVVAMGDEPLRDVEHAVPARDDHLRIGRVAGAERSEEHTSELQSQSNLVCRLLLEKKKTQSQLAVSLLIT